jgi:ectoine hydroxylase-related dioxygenase (phytanoyl-CoA dioxygenase family)
MMNMYSKSFETDGFLMVSQVLSREACESFAARIQPGSASGGTRCLLSESWCVLLAKTLRMNPAISELLPVCHVAVQCTYFEKSSERNWLVPIHQDLSIPVANRVDEPSLRGWSIKEGSLFVQAPTELLEKLVAIRVHLDACDVGDGALRVLSGSHLQGVFSPSDAITLRNAGKQVECHAAQGSAMVMRPLLLHASSKSTGKSRRRVLHFVFGPRVLPHGLQWENAL